MKKQVLAVVCSLSLLIAAGACKKKEEAPVPKTGMPGQGMPPGAQPGGQPNIVVPKGEKKVVIPDAVKGNWKSVVLVVTDKKSNKQQEFTVNLNSDLKVPNSGLQVSVGEYLPDFRMEGLNLTSASNDPNNPAVGVSVTENGKEIFKGWLYAKFPTMHPFEHPNFSIILKEGKKG